MRRAREERRTGPVRLGTPAAANGGSRGSWASGAARPHCPGARRRDPRRAPGQVPSRSPRIRAGRNGLRRHRASVRPEAILRFRRSGLRVPSSRPRPGQSRRETEILISGDCSGPMRYRRTTGSKPPVNDSRSHRTATPGRCGSLDAYFGSRVPEALRELGGVSTGSGELSSKGWIARLVAGPLERDGACGRPSSGGSSVGTLYSRPGFAATP
jgi:hypothetical protein